MEHYEIDFVGVHCSYADVLVTTSIHHRRAHSLYVAEFGSVLGSFCRRAGWSARNNSSRLARVDFSGIDTAHGEDVMPDYHNFYRQDEFTALQRRQRADQRLWAHIVWHRRRRRLIRQGKLLLLLGASVMFLVGVWKYLV